MERSSAWREKLGEERADWLQWNLHVLKKRGILYNIQSCTYPRQVYPLKQRSKIPVALQSDSRLEQKGSWRVGQCSDSVSVCHQGAVKYFTAPWLPLTVTLSRGDILKYVHLHDMYMLHDGFTPAHMWLCLKPLKNQKVEIPISWNLFPSDVQCTCMYTIVPEAEVNTGEYSLVYKPRLRLGLYN